MSEYQTIFHKVMDVENLSEEEKNELLLEFDLGDPEEWVVIQDPNQFLVKKDQLYGNETVIRHPDKEEMIKNLI